MLCLRLIVGREQEQRLTNNFQPRKDITHTMATTTPNNGGMLYAGHYEKLPLLVRPLAQFKDWAQSDWSGARSRSS
jgi:hypothetical protein